MSSALRVAQCSHTRVRFYTRQKLFIVFIFNLPTERSEAYVEDVDSCINQCTTL